MAEVSRDAENRRLLWKLVTIACAMFGFGFALVPFYEQICAATGINNLFNAGNVVNTQIDSSRTLTVELDANINGLPWRFAPRERAVRVHPGELVQIAYMVRNDSDRPIVGQAVPSYGPQLAGKYFKKLDCFCFTQQTLAPGEARVMPVLFVIDPAMPAEVSTITLSYTFFELKGAAAAPAGRGDAG
jgi:cytochrome c oxidase assembly protein subunit 11